jgi:hypothetical protein
VGIERRVRRNHPFHRCHPQSSRVRTGEPTSENVETSVPHKTQPSGFRGWPVAPVVRQRWSNFSASTTPQFGLTVGVNPRRDRFPVILFSTVEYQHQQDTIHGVSLQCPQEEVAAITLLTHQLLPLERLQQTQKMGRSLCPLAGGRN